MRHLISIEDLSLSEIEKIVFESVALSRKKKFSIVKKNKHPLGLIFLEPSTRTRVTFERAAQLLKKDCIVLNAKGSSFEKGETLEDALLYLRAYDVQTVVIRLKEEGEIDKLRHLESLSLVSGGEGVREHPTQALLDLATLADVSKVKTLKGLKGFRMAIVGDLKHSRVVGSWIKLAHKLGVELVGLAPQLWQREGFKQAFLEWPQNEKFDAVMALRIQKERLGPDEKIELSALAGIQVTEERLAGRWLLHPGPVNWGSELSENCQKYSKNLILKQARMGMFTRAVILNSLNPHSK